MSSPSDILEREKIERELDRCLLVEASAGTGKTRAIVRRMVALVRSGRCEIERLVAVTFTRKAAAELRDRFRVELQNQARSAEGEDRQRLRRALRHIELCFVGTIHSFCARLLRERPVEAGVDIGFREMEPEEDRLVRQEAWRIYVSKLHAENSPILQQLAALGLAPSDLGEAFMLFADHRDVREWPYRLADLGDLGAVVEALREYSAEMEEVARDFPSEPVEDYLMRLYRQVPRMLRYRDLSQPAELFAVLSLFEKKPYTRVTTWPGGRAQGNAEEIRYLEFQDRWVTPMLRLWREHRYPTCLQVLRGALEEYQRQKRERCVLDFQDLLLEAAALLKDKPHVRSYFRQRFTHLLVDEFQDTDPIQAEVMLYLTADDPNEMNWLNCKPVPGSLFVVGDPKQSIYRFRRADITTYRQVKAVIEASGGEVVHLDANFRSVQNLVEWVNDVYLNLFGQHSEETSPEYSSMSSVLPPATESPVFALDCPRSGRSYPKEEEARRVAGIIAHRIASDICEPKDFLVLTPQKNQLACFSEALREYGVPNSITGGNSLALVPEVRLFYLLAKCLAEPDNEVAVLAVLRSELFGLADSDLFDHVQQGGQFRLGACSKNKAVASALDTLASCRRHVDMDPPVTALEKSLGLVGLWAKAVADWDGLQRAGALGKLLASLRNRGGYGVGDIGSIAERLQLILQGLEEQDVCPAVPPSAEPVRIMNLHQAKGLEAKEVFLAATKGSREQDPEVFIDRSSKEPKGYLVVSKPRTQHTKDVLAQPENWQLLKEREKAFEAAERDRLRYVAATRARERLVISRFVDSSGGLETESLWSDIHGQSPDLPLVPEPEVKPPGSESKVDTVGKDEPWFAEELIRMRLAAARVPTYSSEAAKRPASQLHLVAAYGEDDAMQWGSAIHRALEIAMKYPDLPLASVVSQVLEEQGLPTSLSQEAEETVQAALESDLLKKALSAPRRFLEVPFSIMEPEKPVPSVVHGVIDLVFEEPPGWVIVDYKTDKVPKEGPGALLEKYASQLRAYVQAWRLVTGEPVRECGLYLTQSNQFVAMPL